MAVGACCYTKRSGVVVTRPSFSGHNPRRLNFRTAFRLHGGQVVTEPAKIRAHYVRTWFPLDLLASVPLSLFFVTTGIDRQSGANANKLLRMLRFAKLSKLIRILKMGRIFQRLGTFGINPGYMRLATLVFKLFGMWHIIACIYWAIAVHEGFCTWYGEANSNEQADDGFYEFGDSNQARPNAFSECINHWMPWEGIEREPLSVQYMQSFFWAVMVTSGIGYDVAPQTNIECAFTIMVICLGIMMYVKPCEVLPID
jgi:hypothetical protein